MWIVWSSVYDQGYMIYVIKDGGVLLNILQVILLSIVYEEIRPKYNSVLFDENYSAIHQSELFDLEALLKSCTVPLGGRE